MADVPVSRDVIYQLARMLDRERVSYAYMGGVALNIWGIPRASFDLDVTLSIEEGRLGPLLTSFEHQGFVVESMFMRGHLDRIGEMPKVHVQLPVGATLLTVDIFLARTPFLESVIARRVPVDLGQGRVFVVTAADLLLFKVVAGRRKDVVDVENILAVQGVPEREYLDSWATVLGVKDRLAAVLRDRK